jgi:HAD superfamily hydrolase (TIGR01509 family)
VNRPIKALLFDLDDTIVGSEELNARLLREFLHERYGIDLTPAQERETYFWPWMDTFRMLGEKFAIAESFETVWESFFETKRLWLAENRMRLARGAPEVLALPVPKAIVSGSLREEIRLTLANVCIPRETFDVILSSQDVRLRKPHPEGFLKALEALGARAEEAIVFEDSPLGIQAAKACGLPVAFMREFAAADVCAEAMVCFDTFEQALPWLRQRIAGQGG